MPILPRSQKRTGPCVPNLWKGPVVVRFVISPRRPRLRRHRWLHLPLPRQHQHLHPGRVGRRSRRLSRRKGGRRGPGKGRPRPLKAPGCRSRTRVLYARRCLCRALPCLLHAYPPTHDPHAGCGRLGVLDVRPEGGRGAYCANGASARHTRSVPTPSGFARIAGPAFVAEPARPRGHAACAGRRLSDSMLPDGFMCKPTPPQAVVARPPEPIIPPVDSLRRTKALVGDCALRAQATGSSGHRVEGPVVLTPTTRLPAGSHRSHRPQPCGGDGAAGYKHQRRSRAGAHGGCKL
jgi:hypothetical protein